MNSPGLGVGRILVGTNGSPQAEAAVGQGARLAKLTGARLSVVFVLDPGHPSESDAELEAERVLRRATDIAAGFGIEAEHLTVAGGELPPTQISGRGDGSARPRGLSARGRDDLRRRRHGAA